MSNTFDEDVTQDKEGTAFRRKVARSLSKEGTVEELQEQGDTFVTLHLDDDEAVLMQGAEVDAWLAEEDNRQAYLDAQDDRKREDQLKADDYKAEDAKRTDYRREDEEALMHERDRAEEADRDIDVGEFSLGEDKPARTMDREDKTANNRVWNQYVQPSRQEPQANVAEPEERGGRIHGGTGFVDIRGNAITLQQMDDIMKSRAELKAHLDAQRTASARAAGYDQAAIHQKDETRMKNEQYGYHKSVGADAAAATSSTNNTEAPSQGASSTAESAPQSRGASLRAYAATIATRDKEITQEREREQDRNNGR